VNGKIHSGRAAVNTCIPGTLPYRPPRQTPG
jgi:hypothetical protein